MNVDVGTTISTMQSTANDILNDGLDYLNRLVDISHSSAPYISGGRPLSVSGAELNSNLDTGNLQDIINSIKELVSSFNIDVPDNINFSPLPTIGDFSPEDIDTFNENAPEFNENINTNISFPDMPHLDESPIPQAPQVNLPDIPTLKDINIPDMPTLDMLSLDVNIPDFNAILPDLHFDYSENEYSSNLYNKLEDAINTNLDGGTLLPEREMFDRSKERDLEVLHQTINETLDLWASRGFDLPNGLADQKVENLLKDWENKRMDLSRDIAIEEAKIRRENINNAINSGINLEKSRMQYYSEYYNRALEVSKYLVESGISIYNMKVIEYNTLIKAAQEKINLFDIKLKSNLQKLEMFKSQIEALNATSSLNDNLIKVYLSQIEAVKSKIDIYKSKIEALNMVSQNNANRILAYRTLIEGQVSKLNASLKKVDVYLAKVNAFRAKIDAYKAKAAAIENKNQLKKTALDIRMKEIDAAIQKNKFEIDKYMAKLEKDKTVADINKSKIIGLTEASKSYFSLENLKADIEKNKAFIDIKSKELLLEQQKSQALIDLETAKANITAMIENSKIAERAAESGGQIYAALASSALAGLNAAVSQVEKIIESEGQ